jgi:hypothetical protein
LPPVIDVHRAGCNLALRHEARLGVDLFELAS